MQRTSSSNRRWGWPIAIAVGVSVGVSSIAGCGDDDDNPETPLNDAGPGIDVITPDGGADTSLPTDPGNISTVAVAANSPDVMHPFDSTPDPAGLNIYFTGYSTADGTAGVFKVAATGGAVTKVFSGAPLVTPLNIAITVDGTQLFIADPSAATATDKGAIYTLAAAGGSPAVLGGTDGYKPGGLAVVGTTLYFTGKDKTTGLPGVFKIPVAGGAATVVTSGAPLQDPSGVIANAAGDVFFSDTSSTNRLGVIYKVAAGQTTPTVLSANLGAGYPSGIALSGDGTALLASAISQTTYKDEVRRIDLVTGNFTASSAGAIGSNIEAAGLHRAHNANVYSWADSLAGGTGTVYLLK